VSIAAYIRGIRDGLLAEHLGVGAAALGRCIERKARSFAGIEALRGSGCSLFPCRVPDLMDVEKWLAGNESSPEERFESAARPASLAPDATAGGRSSPAAGPKG
jgi:hypothetical protein